MMQTLPNCGHSWLAPHKQSSGCALLALCLFPVGDPADVSAMPAHAEVRERTWHQGLTVPAPFTTTKPLSKPNGAPANGAAAMPEEQGELYSNTCSFATKQKQRHELAIFFFYCPP